MVTSKRMAQVPRKLSMCQPIEGLTGPRSPMLKEKYKYIIELNTHTHTQNTLNRIKEKLNGDALYKRMRTIV